MPPGPPESIVVTAPSRLHFGMFSFGQIGVRQFGGVGIMLEAPPVRVSIRPADRFTVAGEHADRAEQFARAIVAQLRRSGLLAGDQDDPRFSLNVDQAPREHIGLGLGTQLGLSIAAGLCAWFEISRPPAVELARLAGRGARSAIGTHGFDHGGLLLEAGKLSAEAISPLVARLDFPPEWRFVLFLPAGDTGLAGSDEQQAFSRLPPVPRTTTDRLLREAVLHLLPAAATRDFGEFSASLYRFGHLAGSCFAREQGGAFADQRTAGLIERLRQMGIEGVGQSSWGPTVFALCECEKHARALLRKLDSSAARDGYQCLVSPASNRGATVEVITSSSALVSRQPL